ncbi:neuropeptide FF receptor 2-like [Brachionus plicatilis]|uniref:Neuropeptide FF receptor 2-like n=1 Tax=Brachionus plicatilis TaxID=10195 RepID=A0A3M7PFT4_BRAPC|nr:neuropeptide FF receptor 2-like [Brachionus plicatilis]
MHSILLETINSTLTCHIFPRSRYPQGLYLTYETCPEVFDNQTAKIVRYCCLNIMITLIQDSIYKKTQDWLRYNSSSVLVGPAVIFNILSLIVLTKFHRIKSFSKNSTTFYMKCLCIFDTLTIVSKFLNEIVVVRNGLRQEPWAINSFVCKFLSFSESCSAISSIYILIAMSFEKLICVLAPLQVGLILTRFKAKIASLSILIVAGLISSYNLFDRRVFVFEWFEEIEQNNLHSNETLKNYSITRESQKRVSYDCDSRWPKKKNDWLLLNNIIRVFLPIILLCACNSWIIVALTKAKKNSQVLFSTNANRQSLKKSNNSKNSSPQNFLISDQIKPKLSNKWLDKSFTASQRRFFTRKDERSERRSDDSFRKKRLSSNVSMNFSSESKKNPAKLFIQNTQLKQQTELSLM